MLRNAFLAMGLLLLIVCPNPSAFGEVLVYCSDFEGAVGSEWSTSLTDVTPIGSRRFLGQFANTTVELTLSGLPLHTELTVSCDLFIIRTWDGSRPSQGPDLWKLEIAGESVLLYTTFRANDGNPWQAYPGWYPEGYYDPATGSDEQLTLGYQVWPNGERADWVYNLSYTGEHTGDSATIRFEPNLHLDSQTPPMFDETWGIDNVCVFVNEPEEGALSGIVVEVGPGGQVLGPLQGATISLSTGEETLTGPDGTFSIAGVGPSCITTTVSKAGFFSTSRDISLPAGTPIHETFHLLAQTGGTIPNMFDLDSPDGNHLIEGMPDDVSFSVTVAWNGSPGSIDYVAGGTAHPASLTDLGGGLARASAIFPIPSSVEECSEITIVAANGEGHSTVYNTGVRVSPTPGIIGPWFQESIPWISEGLTLGYSREYSYDWDLSLPGDALKLKASVGFDAGLSYDLFGSAFSGSLAGTGCLKFATDIPGSPFEIIGGATMKVDGDLDASFAGCGAPSMTPSWKASYTGKAGVEAPAVAVVDVVFPPAAPAVHALLATPIVKHVVRAMKVKVLIIGGASVSGAYSADDWSGDCFLGAEEVDISGTMGIEAEAALGLLGAKAGVYAGGTGTPKFEVCPDLAFENLTLQAHVGVYAKAFGYESTYQVGAEVCFGDCDRGAVISGTLVDEPPDNGKWKPIGDSLLRWGETNRLTQGETKRQRGSDSLTISGWAMEETLVENVTQLASPSIIATPTETHITYVLHDPALPWHIATDIASLRSVDGLPWVMGRFSGRFVGDFDPTIKSVNSDLALATWEEVDGDVSGATDPGDVVPYLNIAVSWFDRTTEQWTGRVLLEENEVVDRAPRPIMFGGTTGIIWIQNEGDASPGHATSGDRLMFAQWDGSDWAVPQILWSGAKGILSFSFAEDLAGEGHVIFAVDEDGDLETPDDRELYGVETLTGVWQSAALLTSDTVEDAIPVLVAPGGDVMCIWASGSELVYTPLATWNPQPVYAEYTLANEAPSLDGVTMPGGAAVAYTVQHGDGVDIVAAFYDAVLDQWSLPRQLTQDEHAETALSLACDGTQLVMAYLKTQTERNEVDIEIEGEIYHLEDVPQPGRTDLCVLRHTLGHDLAVNADSLVLEPANPEPGTTATIRATVENRGELVAQNVECAFYDGDPEAGGTLIDSIQTVPGSLIAGSGYEVEVTWDVPTFPMSHDIFVVADPTLAFDDRDRANNSTVEQTLLPDIAIGSASSEQVAYRSLALTARCLNEGVIPTGTFELSWRWGSVDGPEIGRSNADSIVPGGARDVAFVWDASEIAPGEWVQVFVVADDLDEITEVNEANNVHSLSAMTPELIPGDMNCDSAIDMVDVPLFVEALLDPAAFDAAHPSCGSVQGDLDGSGLVHGDDVQAFVEALLQGA